MAEEKKKKDGKAKPGEEEFGKALTLWDAGDVQGAVDEFSKAAEKDFKKDAVENNIGASYEKLGRIDEAIEHYRSALKSNPSNFFALKNLGESLFSLGRLDEATPYFAKAVSMKPDDAEVRIDYFLALLQMDEVGKAVKVSKPFFEDGASLETMLEAIKALKGADAYPDLIDLKEMFPKSLLENAAVLRILGEAYHECGSMKEAVESLEKSMEKDPNPATKSWLGLALLSDGQEEGMKLLTEAMNEDENDIDILRNMSFALHGNDQLEDALAVYEKSIKLRPDDWVVWNNWGNALYNLGRYKESIPKFVTAIGKNPDYEIAWNNIGNALEKMGKFQESIPFHNRAIEINPDFDYAHYAVAFAMRMSGDGRMGDRELDRSLSLQPVFPEAWMLKAKASIVGSPELAIAYAVRAVELDPESIEPIVVLAMCQISAGQHADAERNLRVARDMAKDSNDAESLKEIEELKADGMTAVNRILAAERILDEGVSTSAEALDDVEDGSAKWYGIGKARLSKEESSKAVEAFRIAHELDPESPAILSDLLRLEKNKKRLRRYIEDSKRIISKGLSTSELEAASNEASKRTGGS